ncbi:MAG: aminoglycoside phosphotransferase (APT) family kinase protein [Bacillariaceae sp.]|jgi:aminoglycoside phosphotransferase (APT) family kinase protein
MLQQMRTNTANDIDSRIQWDPLVKKILEKAMENISWELQLQRLNEGTHFCLVHGDFWPGNVMISKNSIGNLRLLDWEMVGTYTLKK